MSLLITAEALLLISNQVDVDAGKLCRDRPIGFERSDGWKPKGMKAGSTAPALFPSLSSPVSDSQYSLRNALFPQRTRLLSQTVSGCNLLSLVWIRNPVNRDYECGTREAGVSVRILPFPSGLAPDVPQ